MVHPDLTEEEVQFFVGGATIHSYKARTYLITPDRPHHTIWFVAQGFVRGYYIDDRGEEITTRLLKEGGFATHYKAFLLREPSKYYFQCLEDCVVAGFTYDHVQAAYAQHPALEKLGRLIAEEIIKILEYRIESFQFMDAKARYLDFMRQYPEVYDRISLSHLSSYLGIARPSLSRIRKNIAKG